MKNSTQQFIPKRNKLYRHPGLALYHGLGMWPDAGQAGEYAGDAGRCAQQVLPAGPWLQALRSPGRIPADGGGGDAVK